MRSAKVFCPGPASTRRRCKSRPLRTVRNSTQERFLVVLDSLTRGRLPSQTPVWPCLIYAARIGCPQGATYGENLEAKDLDARPKSPGVAISPERFCERIWRATSYRLSVNSEARRSPSARKRL